MGLMLSYVVPVYNVEGYLSRCVDSILAQGLTAGQYEIIIVDDGSTDRSGQIADDYAYANENVKVIHQGNGGLSAARNAGLSASNGRFIQFVDSDDYLEPYASGSLLQKMEKDDLDVLRFDYRNVDESNRQFCPNKEDKLYVDFSDEICDGPSFLTEKLGFACYAWQFMIRTSLLIENGILFKDGVYFEDTEWTPRMLSASRRVTSINTIVYNYQFRIGSITKAISTEKKKKIKNDRLELIRSLQKQSLSSSDRRWYDGMVASVVIAMLNEISRSSSKDAECCLQEIKELQVYPLSYYHLSKRAARKARIINFSPRAFCMFYKLKNR